MNQNEKHILTLVNKLLDYECDNLKSWFNECDKEGFHGSNSQKIYQANHNLLIDLKQKLNLENLKQFENLNYPKAKEKIYIK